MVLLFLAIFWGGILMAIVKGSWLIAAITVGLMFGLPLTIIVFFTKEKRR